jgi:hypothetical protein
MGIELRLRLRLNNFGSDLIKKQDVQETFPHILFF